MNSRFALILVTLAVAACKPQTPAMAVEPLAPVEEDEEFLDLQAALHCGDAAFMRLSAEQQLSRLRKLPQWRCDAREEGPGPNAALALECVPTEPQRAYGARILSWRIKRPMNGADIQMLFTVQGDADELRQLASRVWKRPFDDGGTLALSDDGAVLAFSQNANDGEATVRCALPTDSKARLDLPEGWQAVASGEAPVDSGAQAFERDPDPYEGMEKLEGDALKKALPTCGADHWLAGDFDTRLAELNAIGVACTKAANDGGREAECAMPAGARSFGGYAVEKFVVYDEGGVHEANFTVRAPAAKLAAAMAKDTMTELTEYGDSAGMYVNLIDDRFRFIVWPDAGNPRRSVLNCRMSEMGLEETLPQTTDRPNRNDERRQADKEQADKERADKRHEDEREIPAGSIGGDIRYPEAEIPAMRICATYRGGMMSGCTLTNPGQKSYRIEHLAPAEAYVVMASIEQSPWPIGGHAQPIRCIQAPCPDSTLIPVDLRSGQAVTGIDINEFLSSADSWPPMPVEDGR
ncbi:MAG: hypothetical protein E6Q88_06200 [Lysobacteraceae bacterium]|nr:MAG: hypothetical protein E6Q88_06200 [Xanthomonadaceae bacterium]